MNLIIDQGNTQSKLAVFEQNNLIDFDVYKNLNEEIINTFLKKYPIKNAIISSVKENIDINLLKIYNFLQLSYTIPLPLKIKYLTPNTLGIDRIAAVVGAKTLFQNANILIVDMGTCITFDFLNQNNDYLGGSISPGLNMRFKALNQYTGKLPLIKFDKKNLRLIGNSTETSIISGIYNGIKNELNATIAQYLMQYPKLKIVVTGGDYKLFDLEPKNRIFADKFLVLKGLNEILNYNEKN